MTDSAQASRQLLALGRLSQLEWEIRGAADRLAIAYIAANDTRRIVGYDRAFVWLAEDSTVVCVSGGIRIDAHAPQMQWVGRLAKHMAAKGAVQLIPVETAELPSQIRGDAGRWLKLPMCWLPLTGPGGWTAGGLLIEREALIGEAEVRLLQRLGGAYGGALAAIVGVDARPGRAQASWRNAAVLATAIAACVLVMPMRAVVLAEAKVVPAEPRIIAAPMDGVIQGVFVKPNEVVAAGQSLVRFDRTELAAAESIAARKVSTLGADHARAEAQGFRDPKARAEIGLLMARLDEGEIELAHARHRLARSMIAAESDGIVLIDDPLAWSGRPVRVGERIMAIADPTRVRLEIALAPEDAAITEAGAETAFFLASAPADPVAAKLSRISHEARVQGGQAAVFIAEAEFEGGTAPRLGLTGTAKIYGAPRPLAYLLLRKPLAALRRLTGL